MTVPATSLSGAAARFVEETRDLFVQRTRIGCWLTLTLVPAGSLLDYVSYPDRFYQILAARVLCTAAVAGIYWALGTSAGRERVLWLSLAWGLAPALTIAWMIYLTEGGASPFYAGLNLVILGTCVLAPFTLSQSASYCAAVYVAYAVACFAHGGIGPAAEPFVANSIFILMTSVICVTFSHFNDVLRRRDFSSREAVERQNRELRELDEMKTRFFANVSHELRTPLTLILAPIHELLRGGRAPAETSLRTIERSALRLSRLIDDLLDLVRLENSAPAAPRRVAFDANARLQALHDSAGPLARARGVKLELRLGNELTPTLADPEQFDRAVLNLLSNALKFTPGGGCVALRCLVEEDRVVVEVEDTGIGIAAEDLPRVTERFAQADESGTRRHNGLGLGLALVKGIVESHGGTLEIRSVPHEGTCVTLRFPRSHDELTPGVTAAPETVELAALRLSEFDRPEPSEASGALAPGSSNARVLVADDEPDLREFLRDTIGREWTAAAVADGDAALEALRRERPEVAVLDMMMPGRSGLDVCRELRKFDPDADTRVLLLTARVDEDLKLEALDAGADDFLFKPFSVAEVRARVGNLVRTAVLQRALRGANEELRGTLRRLGETQAQLLQSEKMNSLGALAAGILHEFKNPLNHALMAVAMARRIGSKAEAKLAGELHETLADAEGALRRIDGIASDLRSFAHPEKGDAVQSFALGPAVSDAIRFVGADLAGVEVDSDLPTELVVACPRTHLVQLLVNLLSNAAAAVRETAQARVARVSITARVVGDRVEVRVRDNGVGIPPDRLPRVFEPFYTTKAVGEGTGLGLTVSHAIASRWGSQLTVASESDAWTEFAFDLPLADPTFAQKASA